MTDVRTWLELPGAISAGQSAIVHSVIYAAGAATFIILAGWQMSSRLARAIGWMSLVTPGVLLGIVSIYLFNRQSTGWLYPGHALVMSLLALKYLIVGLLVRRAVLGSVAGAWMEQARQSGATHWQRWVEIEWPRSRLLLTVGWTTAFVFCLWDVETILMVLPPGAETLSVRVFNLLHYGHNSQVNALCLTMMVLALVPACLLLLHNRRRTYGLIAILIPAVLAGCGDGSSSPKVPELQSAFFSEVQIIGSRGTGAGQFNKPRSVAVDKAGNIYAIDMTGRLQKFDTSGKFVKSYQMPQTDKGRPKGMCIDEQGRVVLVEPHYSRLNYFTPELELVAQWGVHGTNSGELSFPRSVAVRTGGTVLVSEYGAVERIQWFEREGKRWLGETRAAGIAPGEFNRPEGIGLDLKGNLYVADSCNHRVQVFDTVGKVLRVHGKAGTGAGEFSYPYDVRVDRDGYEFVCEFGNSRIQIFDPSGKSVELLGGAGAEAGNLSNPWAIAVDDDGNLYVADSGNHRIQKFLRKQRPMAAVGRIHPDGEGNR
ncbi:MAG TPA: 6-bladed beta-propeller [Roseimicrobium sp.]|nr:6-bladed beta-propeller [Roseimicrobium sp.]